MAKAPFTFVELFAGIGGFRVALEALGGRCEFACEIEAQVCKCIQKSLSSSK